MLAIVFLNLLGLGNVSPCDWDQNSQKLVGGSGFRIQGDDGSYPIPEGPWYPEPMFSVESLCLGSLAGGS